jgi:hypothetical protein
LNFPIENAKKKSASETEKLEATNTGNIQSKKRSQHGKE